MKGVKSLDVCKHIEPVLKYELSRGNNVLDYSKDWSQVNLSITLEFSMDVKGAKKILSDPMMYWKNTDTHYSLQEGFLCTKCKQSIAGPLNDSDTQVTGI